MNSLYQRVEELFRQAQEHPVLQMAARPSQLEMALRLCQALENERHLLIEAPTGTGKSLAYLAPLLLRESDGRPAIVSTKTVQLQTQLLTKEIPTVLELCSEPKKVVLARGWSNYLCLARLERAALGGASTSSEKLAALVERASDTRTVLTKQNSDLPEAKWRQVEADPWDCPKRLCPHFKNCGLFRERRNLEGADLVITNHALLLHDLRLKRSGSSLLPASKVLVVDEAHRLEEVATEHLAVRFDRRTTLYQLGAPPSPETSWFELVRFELMGQAPSPDGLELTDQIDVALYALYGCRAMAEELFALLEHLGSELAADGSRSTPIGRLYEPDGEEVLEAAQGLLEALKTCVAAYRGCEVLLTGVGFELRQTELRGKIAQLERMHSDLEFLLEASDPDWVFGLDLPHGEPVARPIEGGEILKTELFAPLATACLTSASLAINGRFDFVLSRLGLERERLDCHLLASPLALTEQAFVGFVNEGPEPNSLDYVERVAPWLCELVEGLEGRTLLLTTSHRRVREFHRWLLPGLAHRGIEVLRQGDAPTPSLLKRFTSPGRRLLIGVDSLWEGVDIPGERLSCVIVTRLPFPVPNDPLFEARSRRVLENGGNPFYDLSLPYVCLKLKQGFGRLLRSENDRGLFLVLDPRLCSKRYGTMLRRDLPSENALLAPLDLLVGDALRWCFQHLGAPPSSGSSADS